MLCFAGPIGLCLHQPVRTPDFPDFWVLASTRLCFACTIPFWEGFRNFQAIHEYESCAGTTIELPETLKSSVARAQNCGANVGTRNPVFHEAL